MYHLTQPNTHTILTAYYLQSTDAIFAVLQIILYRVFVHCIISRNGSATPNSRVSQKTYLKSATRIKYSWNISRSKDFTWNEKWFFYQKIWSDNRYKFWCVSVSFCRWKLLGKVVSLNITSCQDFRKHLIFGIFFFSNI